MEVPAQPEVQLGQPLKVIDIGITGIFRGFILTGMESDMFQQVRQGCVRLFFQDGTCMKLTDEQGVGVLTLPAGILDLSYAVK